MSEIQWSEALNETLKALARQAEIIVALERAVRDLQMWYKAMEERLSEYERG